MFNLHEQWRCSPLHFRPGVNIFQNSPRKIGEKFPNFLGSGEEFDEIQFQACCHNLELGSDNYLE